MLTNNIENEGRSGIIELRFLVQREILKSAHASRSQKWIHGRKWP